MTVAPLAEFREAGLLWWVNRIIMLFGWVIITEVEMGEKEKVTKCYPARTKFRGFDAATEDRSYKKLTDHLAVTINDLSYEVIDEEKEFEHEPVEPTNV